jgi:hypothetical protein
MVVLHGSSHTKRTTNCEHHRVKSPLDKFKICINRRDPPYVPEPGIQHFSQAPLYTVRTCQI